MAAVASHNILRISRRQYGPVVGLYNSQRRDVHDATVKNQYNNMAAYRRGKGGRSSFSGIVATVFGASGNMGNGVVSRLGKMGSQVICPYRGDTNRMRSLKLMGDLGQILFVPYQLKDDESVRRAMKYSNVVVNCIGNFYETRNYKYLDVHADGPERIARLAKECGVQRLIHISDINATNWPQGRIIPGGSNYLMAKQLGEDRVKEAFPEATIIRPSSMFGNGDRMIWFYSLGAMRSVGTIPLLDEGQSTFKAPVYNTDCLSGITRIIKDPNTAGQTFEFYGPRMYRLSDLVEYFIRNIRSTLHIVNYETNYPYQARIKLNDYINQKTFRQGLITSEILEWNYANDRITGAPNLEDLGVKLTPIELITHTMVKPHRMTRYKEDIQMEAVAELPPPVHQHLAKNQTRPDPS